MKKAFIIIATLILVAICSTSVLACESPVHIPENEGIIRDYVATVKSGNYYHTDNSYFVSILDGRELYQTFDNLLIYDGQCICADVSTLGIPTIKTELINYYMEQIEAHNYIESFGKTSYLTFDDNFDVFYITEDGRLMYNSEVLVNNIATMDNGTGTIIYQNAATAISVDDDFIYVYHFGEIVNIINIHTGGQPRG